MEKKSTLSVMSECGITENLKWHVNRKGKLSSKKKSH